MPLNRRNSARISPGSTCRKSLPSYIVLAFPGAGSTAMTRMGLSSLSDLAELGSTAPLPESGQAGAGENTGRSHARSVPTPQAAAAGDAAPVGADRAGERRVPQDFRGVPGSAGHETGGGHSGFATATPRRSAAGAPRRPAGSAGRLPSLAASSDPGRSPQQARTVPAGSAEGRQPVRAGDPRQGATAPPRAARCWRRWSRSGSPAGGRSWSPAGAGRTRRTAGTARSMWC